MTCICYESKLTILVSLPDLCNLLVSTGAQDFNEALYICYCFTDSTVQSFGIIESLYGREEKSVYKKKKRKRKQREEREQERWKRWKRRRRKEEGRRRWKKKDKELKHRGTLGSIKATMHTLKLPEVSDLSSRIRSWRWRSKMVKDLKSFCNIHIYYVCTYTYTHLHVCTYTHTLL